VVALPAPVAAAAVNETIRRRLTAAVELHPVGRRASESFRAKGCHSLKEEEDEAHNAAHFGAHLQILG
jgi:hypothetical protein